METVKAPPVNANIFPSSFIGNLLAAVFFGVLTIQTSSYYHAFPDDRRPVKLAVAFLWTLEAFQIACVTQSLYGWSVKNYDNPLALRRATWEFTTFQICVTFTSVTVQTFFAHRVYSLSGNLYLGALVQVLVLVQFGFGATNAIRSNMIPVFDLMMQKIMWNIVSWLIIQTVADIVIAACMCLLLRRRRTGFQKTDSVITRMILYTIATGLVTGVLSCVALVMFAKYEFGYLVTLGGTYSNTMLTNLHMRKELRARLDTPSPLELIASSVKKRMQRNVQDHGNIERLQATEMNMAREVARDDVDIRPMSHQNSDEKVPFTAVQSPVVLGEPEPELEGSVRSQ
ncbi:hypothetical protein BS47DRAFT_1017425 [Hydnum rufescens UP504]|uniref:DUF6534 domain-containing protein n=1 Tax=Hydnum rufescens UP504 TaxID=1448309 RepID=A0A9P6AWG0_9AGAM|nr:hypothetical protein BS47DRAFT_1017425 [Hydnum rufescens UP504]